MDKNTENLLEKTLNDEKIINKMNEVLKEKELQLKVSQGSEKSIVIQEVKNENNSVEKEKTNSNTVMPKVKRVAFKTALAFLDSSIKNFLKKKYKVNYSTYNDGKKVVKAIKDKDSKTFYKKASDTLLNSMKKLPSEAKKIIKDTKNVAIDEIYS